MSEDLKIDIVAMSKESALKFLEIEWNDHFQTRKQTWTALQVTALIAVAVVGTLWKIKNSFIGALLAFILIAISWFGMQITIRHRSVEVLKFTLIRLFEEKLNFQIISGLELPKDIHYKDILKDPLNWGKQNTSIFILRSQFAVHILGWILFFYNLFKGWQFN